MVLVERPEVQKPLKMCFYQTVAFLYFVEGGRYGEACACCEQAARIADAIEAASYNVYINMIHAYALDCLGRFPQAEHDDLEQAEEAARRCLEICGDREKYRFYILSAQFLQALILSRREPGGGHLPLQLHQARRDLPGCSGVPSSGAGQAVLCPGRGIQRPGTPPGDITTRPCCCAGGRCWMGTT